MADKDQDKTEEPSEKRITEFRDEGKIPRSAELATLMGLSITFTLLFIKGESLVATLLNSMRSALQFDSQMGWVTILSWVQKYLSASLSFFIYLFVAVLSVAFLTSFAQTGFHFSFKTVKPKFSSLNPLSGFKRIFASSNGLVNIVKNFLKLSVIGLITFSVFRDRFSEMVYLSSMDMMQALTWSTQVVLSLLMRIGLFLVVLSSLDYMYQWFQTNKQMKMTRQELRDEMKEQQVSPHVKSKVKQISMERAKRQISKEVPLADVIITNPTHFAIAIRYKRGEDPAPRVVAKGQDHLAKTIRDLAKQHNIPLYEYPELARALYKKVKVGKTVPAEFYRSVAQVLAYIYQLYRKRQMMKGANWYVS